MHIVFMCGDGMMKLMECVRGVVFVAVMLGGLFLLDMTLHRDAEESPHSERLRHAR